jgi:hypothetical protein
VTVVVIVVTFVGVRVSARGVVAERSGLGLKRGAARLDGEPEASHHFVEDVVVFVDEPAVAELDRHVTVAKVVCGAQEHVGITGACDGERFDCSAYDDDRATIREEAIAVSQGAAALQDQRRLAAVVEREAQAAPPALVERQGRCPRRGFRDFVGAEGSSQA